MATSQGKRGASEVEEASKGSLLEPPCGLWLCQHLDFRLQAPAQRENSAVLHYPVGGDSLWQPQEMNTDLKADRDIDIAVPHRMNYLKVLQPS